MFECSNLNILTICWHKFVNVCIRLNTHNKQFWDFSSLDVFTVSFFSGIHKILAVFSSENILTLEM